MTPEDEDDGNAAKHIQLRHPRHLTASTRRGRRGTDGTAIAPRRATTSRGDPPPGRAARPVALPERGAQWRGGGRRAPPAPPAEPPAPAAGGWGHRPPPRGAPPQPTN